MTPVEQAAAVYDREPCARTFREDLELHLLNGYVFSAPTLFVMGRAVRKDAPISEIVDPHYAFDDPDTWSVYVLAGAMNEVWQYMPIHLPWVCFERKNRLRFYRTDEIRARTG